jgi:DNA primase
MAGKIPERFIQDVLARVDLVDLIDARVPLKRSGSSFVARCPFHNEKTPSFSVSREKQFYHCFGCGASGNAIGFLMEYDRLSFPEAVETLADSVGLKLPAERPGRPEDFHKQKQVADLYEVQDRACRFYQAQLKSHPESGRAVEYLKRRGVSGELAQRYRLGYAPPGYRNLPGDLPLDLLKAAGLVAIKDGGSAYDWFRDRIVFPIHDRRGRVVGFGGRVLGDGVPKYLNSPETATFKKSREVYGLHELLNAVRKPEFILVVEGYMDVIALAQFGIPNAVATLGTATSGDHIGLLFRFVSELVFCFDGDTAGRNAAWKALEASLPHLREGRQLRFLELPERHDPDSLVRAEGTDSFLARVRGAKPFSDYFFEHLAERLDLREIEGRAALVKLALPLIDRLPGGIFREMIERRLRELAPGYSSDNSAKLVETRSPTPTKGSGERSPMRLLVALLLQNPQLAATIAGESRRSLVRNEKIGSLVGQVLGLLDQCPGLTPGGILEFFRGSPEEGIIAKMIGWETQVSPAMVQAFFSDTLAWLERQFKDEHYKALIQKSASGSLTPEEREELRTMRQ